MELRVLRRGATGDLVLAWEEFLRGEGYYLSAVDGVFDDETELATRRFQVDNSLQIDGVVGSESWGVALQKGFAVPDTSSDEMSSNWPPKPDFEVLSPAARDRVFGHIECIPAPTVDNPEGVAITNGWAKNNLTTVVVPQTAKILGGRRSGRGPVGGKIAVHKLVAEPLIKLWQAWDDAGLLGLVLTWDGLWCARYVRGSRTNLSNHAYGSAFDINYPWNGLRKTPALKGQQGTVRQLVPIANSLGWYWGGHFERLDGMHFELAKL